MNNIMTFLGLKLNLKTEIKILTLTIILSYVSILFVIFIKSVIVGDNLQDIYILATNLSLFGTIRYGIFCLFQEIIFRAILQQYLIKKTTNYLVSLIITTLLFLLCHFNYDIITIIGALIISIVAGITTIKDNNIYKAFFFHWIFGGLGYVFITIPFLNN